MLNIYTNRNIPKGYILIYDVELEFKCIDCSAIENDEAIKDILRAVNDIRVSHGFPSISDTPSIYDCSTGFKAAIVAYYYRNRKDVLVNIAECGVNVIELLVKLNLDLNLYNSNYVSLGFSDSEVILNGEVVTLCEATGRIIYMKNIADLGSIDDVEARARELASRTDCIILFSRESSVYLEAHMDK